MPTYQYACTACDHRFEAVQAFSDPSLTECPECTGKLRKVYGSVGVVFKGSGFYRNDARAGNSKSTSTATAGDKPAKSESTKSESTRSESTKSDSTSKPAGGSSSSAGSSTTASSSSKAAS